MVKTVFSPQYDEFCRLLVRARRTSKLTQEALAAKLRRPQSFVSKYERGERRLDVVEFLIVADVLQIDPCDLIRKLRRR